MRLIVGGATRIEIAAFFNQREGITHPIGATCFDHVDMGEQEDRLGGLGRALKDCDKAAILRFLRRGEQCDIAVCKSGGLQARRHPFRRQRAAAFRLGRVGFDEFLVQIPEGHLIRPQRLRHRGGRQGSENGRRDQF